MTGRQRKLLGLIQAEIAESGQCPSVQAIGAELGINVSAVSRMMKRLEEQSIIRRIGRRRVEILSVVRRPTLTIEELAWCQANPERVKAMMRLVGGYVGRDVAG